MRKQAVVLLRSENESMRTFLPVWEIPVLQAVHGPEKVSVEDDIEISGDGYPEAVSEYDRLHRRYKEDIQSGVPFVTQIYGQAPYGLTKLAEAIATERALEKKQPKVKASKILEAAPTAIDE